MDIDYLKKLIRIVEKSKVDEIEVEEAGLRIRIGKNSHDRSLVVQQPQGSSGSAQVYPSQPLSSSPEVASPPKETTTEVKYHEVKSPIVGTFYRSPAPDADAYVEIGNIVQPKTVLCIIEAMKLMNEIESDIAGRVVKILVENGQPVEYNQTLFLIEPM